ncbi:hypothetical protein M0802_008845 [Mischocyttarus mexicanus]|nr:hypothetical protein M0802_008845 [Mischocyttarus mexicanus]
MTDVSFLPRRNPSAAGCCNKCYAMLVVQTNGLPSFEQTYANDKCLGALNNFNGWMVGFRESHILTSQHGPSRHNVLFTDATRNRINV